jgi:hypothetical protein
MNLYTQKKCAGTTLQTQALAGQIRQIALKTMLDKKIDPGGVITRKRQQVLAESVSASAGRLNLTHRQTQKFQQQVLQVTLRGFCLITSPPCCLGRQQSMTRYVQVTTMAMRSCDDGDLRNLAARILISPRHATHEI